MSNPQLRYKAGIIAARTPIFFLDKAVISGRERYYYRSEMVTWLASSETIMSLEHGGREVKSFSTHNDFYGYLSSLSHDIDETLNHFSISEESSLELVLNTTIKLVPYFEDDACAKHNLTAKENQLKFHLIELKSSDLCPVMNETIHERTPYLYALKELDVIKAKVYSSKISKESNSSQRKIFVDKWSENEASKKEFEKVVGNYVDYNNRCLNAFKEIRNAEKA